MAEHTWARLGAEGETVTVPPDSTVRYGATPAERYIERVMSGPVFIHNSTFTDPEENVLKALWLRVEATDAPPAPSPPPSPEPSMPIVYPSLPPLPEYPASGTDAQKDQWLRLAALHTSRASAQGAEAVAAANDALAAVHRDLLTEQQASRTFLAQQAQVYAEQAQRSEALSAALNSAIEALTARIGTAGGSAPGSGGLTLDDVAIVQGIASAVKPAG